MLGEPQASPSFPCPSLTPSPEFYFLCLSPPPSFLRVTPGHWTPPTRACEPGIVTRDQVQW